MLRKLLLLISLTSIFVTGSLFAQTLVFSEDFSTGLGGFTVVDVSGSSDCLWTSPGVNADLITYFGDALFAEAESDACGSGTTMDVALETTDSMDLSGYETVALYFNNYYRQILDQSGVIEASVDGGTTWSSVYEYSADMLGAVESIDISSAVAFQSDVKIRFRFIALGWKWYWAVDDVEVIGTAPDPGLYILPVEASEVGSAGDDISYSLLVANFTGTDATVDLAYSGNIWAIEGPSTIDVANESVNTYEMLVSIPSNSNVLDSDSVTIEATLGAYTDSSVITTITKDQWVALNPSTATGTYWGATVALEGIVYFIGGMTGQSDDITTTSKLQAYNPINSTWDLTLPGIPEPAMGFVSGVYDGKIYVAGGFDNDFNGKNTLYIYNPETESWETGATMPFPRGGAAGGIVGDKLYVLGGGNSTSFPTDCPVQIYDIAGDFWTISPDTCPISPASGYGQNLGTTGDVYDGAIYYGGSFSGTYEWYSYAPGKGTFTSLEPIPVLAGHMTPVTAVYGDTLILWGGMINWALMDATYTYNFATDSWMDLGITQNVAEGGAGGTVAIYTTATTGITAKLFSFCGTDGFGSLDPIPFEELLLEGFGFNELFYDDGSYEIQIGCTGSNKGPCVFANIFHVDTPATVSKAKYMLSSNVSELPGSLAINIYNASASGPSGSIVDQRYHNPWAFDVWQEVTFDPPVEVSDWFAVAVDQTDSFVSVGIDQDDPNAGMSYATLNNGGSWAALNDVGSEFAGNLMIRAILGDDDDDDDTGDDDTGDDDTGDDDTGDDDTGDDDTGDDDTGDDDTGDDDDDDNDTSGDDDNDDNDDDNDDNDDDNDDNDTGSDDDDDDDNDDNDTGGDDDDDDDTNRGCYW